MLKIPTLFIALTLGGAAGIAQAQVAQFIVPAHEMNVIEQGALSGIAPLSGVALRTAATARVSAYNQADQAQTERKSGSAALVYAGTHGTSPPKLPTWPTPGPGGLLDFQEEGNLAQAWATSMQTGIPYLYVTGYGSFRAEATAAWSATLAVPSGPSREVVARFVLPPVRVNGDTKAGAEAHWRARMRADFLVNGFPAWSTGAFRLTANPDAQPNDSVVLQQFGAWLTFPQNDEDASGDNNTDTGSTEGASTKRVVYVTLGRLAGGTVLELSLSVRGTALTMPADSFGNRCKYGLNNMERWFCSRATVTVRGESGDGPLFYMLP